MKIKSIEYSILKTFFLFFQKRSCYIFNKNRMYVHRYTWNCLICVMMSLSSGFPSVVSYTALEIVLVLRRRAGQTYTHCYGFVSFWPPGSESGYKTSCGSQELRIQFSKFRIRIIKSENVDFSCCFSRWLKTEKSIIRIRNNGGFQWICTYLATLIQITAPTKI